jgi:DNA-binding GntR family transcriptional regulator
VTRTEGTPAKDFAYEYVKRQILEFVLPPGHIVTEMDIATVTGLSRTPVREAFLRLDAEGLIELLPRRGALVSPVTVRQIKELSETRLVLELYAAQQICRLRIACADELDDLVGRQRALTASGAAYADVIECDVAFHTRLVGAVGNTELTRLYESMGDRQRRTGVAAFRAQPGRPQSALDHHQGIVAALAAYDEPAAEAMLREHLHRSTPVLERYLPH